LPDGRSAAGQNREHRPALERRCAFDYGDIGHPRGDTPNLIAGNFRMRRFATAEAYLDLDFVALLEKSARRAHAHLQVVVVGARAKAHFFDL
jgi:hypothetical protein